MKKSEVMAFEEEAIQVTESTAAVLLIRMENGGDIRIHRTGTPMQILAMAEMSSFCEKTQMMQNPAVKAIDPLAKLRSGAV